MFTIANKLFNVSLFYFVEYEMEISQFSVFSLFLIFNNDLSNYVDDNRVLAKLF